VEAAVKLPGKRKSKFGSEVSRAIFTNFFVTMTGYIVTVVVVFILFKIVFGLFFWLPENPMYRILKAIDNNAVWFIFLCGLGGFIAIFYFYWRKTFGFIDTIVEASEALVEQGEDIIKLPDEIGRAHV
jgi:two-component system sensor histidine kinase VanS